VKGVINKGIQDLVEAKFGADTWEKVKRKAHCDEPFFAASEDYPDEMTLALTQAASDLSGLSLDNVLVEFGKFWVSNTGKETYTAYFNMAGSTPKSFLMNLNKVHEHVTRSIANAKPPRFEYEELEDGRLLMHYQSERGLCQVLRGLILGVGLFFDEDLEVREIACKHEGAPRCTMEVSFLG
jgi:predicted hydrocarbon binding protein